MHDRRLLVFRTLLPLIMCLRSAPSGQLALAWLLAQGEDVVPIPGTKRLQYLEENLAANDVRLSPQEVKELTELADAAQVVGERYDPILMQVRGDGSKPVGWEMALMLGEGSRRGDSTESTE